jgi:hypothetical protein
MSLCWIGLPLPLRIGNHRSHQGDNSDEEEGWTSSIHWLLQQAFP